MSLFKSTTAAVFGVIISQGSALAHTSFDSFNNAPTVASLLASYAEAGFPENSPRLGYACKVEVTPCYIFRDQSNAVVAHSGLGGEVTDPAASEFCNDEVELCYIVPNRPKFTEVIASR